MKVLHFISGGDTGGAKTHVLTLLDELRKQNIDVSLLCIMEGIFTEEARAIGIEVNVILQQKRWDFSVMEKIKAFINNSGCDVVHCHGARANYISLFIMNSVKVPMLTTLHSDYKLDFKDNIKKQLIFTPINSFALRKFRHILTVTEAFKKMLIERGFKEERLRVIYNGIRFDEDVKTYTEEEFFKRIKLIKQQDKIYVGIAARLFAVKGVDVFLKAAAVICKKREDINFIVLGDGDMRAECENIIRENNMGNRVHMAGQITDPVLMNSYYTYIDVNTLTSHSESFPYALLEGARCKCATVATAVGGIPEMIRNEKDGLLAKSGDAADIARCIDILCSDPEKRKQYGESFYNRAKESFSASAMAKKHKQIYEEVIKIGK